MAEKIPLIEVPRALVARYGRSPSRRKIWEAAADARVAAEQLENGRWLVDPADVAAAFGLNDEQIAA